MVIEFQMEAPPYRLRHNPSRHRALILFQRSYIAHEGPKIPGASKITIAGFCPTGRAIVASNMALEPRIDRFAFHREHTEDTLVHAA